MISMDDQQLGRAISAVSCAGALWGTPLFVVLATYCLSPGYICPFLNHPIARLILIGIFLLHTFLCLLLAATLVFRLGKLLRIVSIIFCVISTVVFILVPMLGPACIAILYALGPVNGH